MCLCTFVSVCMCVHTCMYHARRHIIHIIYRYAHVVNCKMTSNQPAYICKPHTMFCNTKRECTQVNHLNNLQSLLTHKQYTLLTVIHNLSAFCRMHCLIQMYLQTCQTYKQKSMAKTTNNSSFESAVIFCPTWESVAHVQ